jgi:hypothetical protein
MSIASQGLRAVASSLETVSGELSPAAQAALGSAAAALHAAADAEAASAASAVGGPVVGGVLAAFSVAMIDGFFSLFAAKQGQAPAATAPQT